ncbi:hypothetical protein [Nostoc sp. 'Peltigera membranacea cyanobiont' 232]|uniref:hypothetical protein n=1 Tax=Nostoc sp. 'Peltigera membranacea cyanobiont' 232 TaxID=2014531 RepID=UPI000B956273|nr:hypothetical protein [Nostoc sp. 'Peltigera membranacea cyanobiont' 232]OYE03916.1 hypothetical protein CDG79_15795 [Nostoc sp. 'Peltigera membranacea cyanobiont' 232]
MSNPILISLKIYLEQYCCDFFSKRQIDTIFSGGGFTRDESINCEYKRDLINQYYKSVDWESPVIIPKLNQVIETILYSIHLSDDAKNNFRKTLSDIGFKFDENKVIYQPIIPNNSLFISQFPVGLPFGKPKPEFAVQIDKGSQKLKFEWKNGIGIIDFNVYPDLTYQKLAQNFNLHLGTTDGSLRRALKDMNQTEYETKFFLHYANKFNMANQNTAFTAVMRYSSSN